MNFKGYPMNSSNITIINARTLDAANFDIVESGRIDGPGMKEGLPIASSYQIGIVRQGTSEPLWKFRVDFTQNYITNTQRSALETVIDLEKRAVEAVQAYLAVNDLYSAPSGYVQGLTMRDEYDPKLGDTV